MMGQPPVHDQDPQGIRWVGTGLMVHAEVLLKTTLFFTAQPYLKP